MTSRCHGDEIAYLTEFLMKMAFSEEKLSLGSPWRAQALKSSGVAITLTMLKGTVTSRDKFWMARVQAFVCSSLAKARPLCQTSAISLLWCILALIVHLLWRTGYHRASPHAIQAIRAFVKGICPPSRR